MAGNGPGLLKYFFKPCRKNKSEILLPDPTGPLSIKVDSAAIEEANPEVTATSASASAGSKCAPYLKLTPEQKAIIGKYAAGHGIVNAIRQFQGDFPKDSLKESTFRGWKKAYLLELESRRRLGKDRIVEELPSKKNRTSVNNGRRSRLAGAGMHYRS